MLKLHGYYYCCLLAFVLLLPACFLFFFHVSFLQPYAKDYALMYHSLCLSRSCLSPFRCPAVSACVCVSRSFGALFLRVPHRGCTGFYLPNRPNILQLLCSMLKLHDRFSFCLPGIDQRFRLVPATLRLSYCPAL